VESKKRETRAFDIGSDADEDRVVLWGIFRGLYMLELDIHDEELYKGL
jgi:hypothetical protein